MITKSKIRVRIDPPLRKLVAQTWLVCRGYTAAQSEDMWHQVALTVGAESGKDGMWFCGRIYYIENADEFTFGFHDLQLLDKYRAPAPKKNSPGRVKSFLNKLIGPL